MGTFDLDTALTTKDVIVVGLGLIVACIIIYWRRK